VIGISGSHRVGKTTLAQKFAQESEILFLQTSASAVFKAAGLDPAGPMTLQERIGVQEAMLMVFERLYAEGAKQSKLGLFITDRTPIDLATYLMAEVQQNSTQGLEDEMVNFAVGYVHRCIQATNRWFSTVVILQPGIQVVEAEGKARGCPLFMEHLNSLMLGLAADERLLCKHYFIPRKYVLLDDRLNALKHAVSAAIDSHAVQRQHMSDPN
jgi:hypothetical protein